MNDMAKYVIDNGNRPLTVRYFIKPCEAVDLTPLEIEAREIIRDGFMSSDDVVAGTVDPFKAAEAILADHYGNAKMVEADYEWRPRVRY